MSRQLVDAKLDKFFGPVSVSTKKFHDVYEILPRDNVFLKQVCQTIPEFTGEYMPTTEDGYFWFMACYFEIGTGIVAVLIPWSKDKSKRDGSKTDRAIAVYTQGNIGEKNIIQILQKFSEAIVEEDMRGKK